MRPSGRGRADSRLARPAAAASVPAVPRAAMGTSVRSGRRALPAGATPAPLAEAPAIARARGTRRRRIARRARLALGVRIARIARRARRGRASGRPRGAAHPPKATIGRSAPRAAMRPSGRGAVRVTIARRGVQRRAGARIDQPAEAPAGVIARLAPRAVGRAARTVRRAVDPPRIVRRARVGRGRAGDRLPAGRGRGLAVRGRDRAEAAGAGLRAGGGGSHTASAGARMLRPRARPLIFGRGGALPVPATFIAHPPPTIPRIVHAPAA
jgi:hypothetical protein